MNKEVRAGIGRRLKESRKAASLTQREVADQFKVERQLVSAWECGRSTPTLDQWFELAPLYGVSLDYLVYGIRTIPVGTSPIMERVFLPQACVHCASSLSTRERLPAS